MYTFDFGEVVRKVSGQHNSVKVQWRLRATSHGAHVRLNYPEVYHSEWLLSRRKIFGNWGQGNCMHRDRTRQTRTKCLFIVSQIFSPWLIFRIREHPEKQSCFQTFWTHPPEIS